MAKHICPVCGNDEFYTNAHVVQGWRVDCDGEFIEETESCVEVTHKPDDDDIWQCTKCGWEGPGKNALGNLQDHLAHSDISIDDAEEEDDE